tara:strand:+ start:216 stop:3416 length:3201 start_codon:yes stop_codon:yes gene_type:complete
MLDDTQKRSYNYYDEEDKVKESIIENDDFIKDARSFLQKREGYTDEDLAARDDVYDAYMEHFRYQNVNEVTAIRDLEYAQNANQQDKEQFARLIDLFETQKSEGFFNAAGDYIQGIASAPSTYAGIATGGAGKLAALGGVNLAKMGIKKLLGEGIKKSAIRAGLTEGAIGTGQGLAQEMTKEETGYQDDISYGNVALTGGISGITGGVIGGGAGILQTRQALKAAEKLDVAQTAQKTLSKKANAKAKATLQKNKNSNAQKYISKNLNALDPEKVDLGIGIAREIADAKELGTLTGKLPTELYENISAAALDLAAKGKLKINKGDRITTVLQRAIADGDLKVPEITKILKEYNLTADKFSLLYKAELSEAGKTMQVQSNLVQTMQASLKELENAGVSTVGAREAKEIAENANKGTFFKDLDRLRLGAMTSQPATTMRNNINAGLRVAVDMGVRVADNILNLRNPFDSVFDVAKYMFNPSEANVTRQLLEGNMPDTARKLFRDAADLASTTGGESKLAQLGTKLNYFNTMSDNFFKQAMLTASLRRRIKDANIKGLGNDLDEIIATGKFNQIPDDIMNKSIKDSLEFVYQSSFEGADKGLIARKTRGFLKAHRDMPFVISSFMPFPRFVANQLKFLYDHAPVIGYIGLENIGKKAGYKKATLAGFADSKLVKEKAAKQIAGASMFATALAWRNQQGDGVTWSEFKDDKGDIIDGKALYGPFAPFMLAADIYYRWSKSNVGGETDIGEIAPSRENYVRETLQALAGSQFRTGYGLYAIDKMIDDLSGEGDFIGSKGEKILGEFIGNVVNTFTIPLSPFKDIYSQFDKESRFVPETRMSGEVNFLDIVMKRGFRALPDVGPEYDMPLADPTKTGRVIAINPLEKQMFGFTRRPKKNTLQAEMGTLNLQYYNIYKRDSNDLIDLYTRHNLSEGGAETNLSERMKIVIESNEYKRRTTLQEKRDYLLSKAKEVTNLAKDKAKTELEEESKGTGKLSVVKQQIWGKIPESDRKTLDTIYKRLMREDKLAFADEGSQEIKDIRSNLNRMILRPNGEVMPLYQWALEVHSRRLTD